MPILSYTPIPMMQFFDENGNPLVNGILKTYKAGTNTPIATYNSEGTQNEVEIKLNSRGECCVRLDTSLSYKFVLCYPEGDVIWTLDNVSASSGEGGGGGGMLEIYTCTEPDWPSPTEMFGSYEEGKDVVIVRQSFSGVTYSVWRLASAVKDVGSPKNYTLEFQNDEGSASSNHKTNRVKFYSTDKETWTITETTFVYPERATIAPNWSSSDVSNYKKGTLVYRAGVLYRCETDTPSVSWVAAEWEQTDIATELARKGEGNNSMDLKYFKTSTIASYTLTGNTPEASVTLGSDQHIGLVRLDDGQTTAGTLSAAVENVIRKARISLGGAGKVLSRVVLSGQVGVNVIVDHTESEVGTDVAVFGFLIKFSEWGEWEDKKIEIDMSGLDDTDWASAYRTAKPVHLVISSATTLFTIEDFNILEDFVGESLSIFLEFGVDADKTTNDAETGLVD